jgi:hypothetical protein
MKRKLIAVLAASALIPLLCAFNLNDLKKKPQPKPKQSATTPAPTDGAAATAQPASPGGVCDASGGVGLCYVFSGANTATKNVQDGNKMACKLFKGQFAASAPCPADNQIGKCTIKAGTPDEYVLYYYVSQNFDATKAAADCTNAKSSVHVQGAGTWAAASVP